MANRKRFAEDLAKDYDFESKEQYFEYIVDSLINGNRSQVRELFNQMHADDKEHFLTDWLPNVGINSSSKVYDKINFHLLGYCTTVKNICIGELCHNPKGV